MVDLTVPCNFCGTPITWVPESLNRRRLFWRIRVCSEACMTKYDELKHADKQETLKHDIEQGDKYCRVCYAFVIGMSLAEHVAVDHPDFNVIPEPAL